MNYWTDIEDEIIKKHYINDGIVILRKLIPQRSNDSIKSRARKLGLRKKIFNTKDENFFETVNTINSSIAGMIASDGHIHIEKSRYNNNYYHQIIITLTSRDIKILEDIRRQLKSTHNIRIFRRKYKIYPYPDKTRFNEGEGEYACYRVFETEKYAKDLLNNWNIPSGKKSLILDPPKNLTNLDHKLAYLCGLINGDGSVYLAKDKNYDCLCIGLLGTKSLLEWCKSVIIEYLGHDLDNNVNEENHSKAYNFYIRGYKAMKLFNKIRSLDCVFLDRKWNNKEILNCIESKRQSIPEIFDIENKPEGTVIEPVKYYFIKENKEIISQSQNKV